MFNHNNLPVMVFALVFLNIYSNDPLTVVAQDREISRWNGHSWSKVAGVAVKISVDQGGRPYVVNSKGKIFRRINGEFQPMPGSAKDIGTGADGSVYVVGSNNSIYKWNGESWDSLSGLAKAISVEPGGIPWVVNNEGKIYRMVNNNFEQVAGFAKDIGIGANGDVWIVGTEKSIFKRNGQNWDPVSGVAKAISVAPDGTPWVINDEGKIFKLVNNEFKPVEGTASDIGIGADGSVWITGGEQNHSSTAPHQGFASNVIYDNTDPSDKVVIIRFRTLQPAIPTIELSEKHNNNFKAIHIQGLSNTISHEIRIIDLKPGTVYYYRITILDENGKPLLQEGSFATRTRID